MTCAPPSVPRERALSSVWALYYKMSGIDASRGVYRYGPLACDHVRFCSTAPESRWRPVVPSGVLPLQGMWRPADVHDWNFWVKLAW